MKCIFVSILQSFTLPLPFFIGNFALVENYPDGIGPVRVSIQNASRITPGDHLMLFAHSRVAALLHFAVETICGQYAETLWSIGRGTMVLQNIL